MPCSAFSVKHRQMCSYCLCSYCSDGSFSWSTHGCPFPVWDNLHIYKILILSLVLELLRMKNSFIIPREILQSEIQWLLEITWVAAEEKHLMGKGKRGRKRIDGENEGMEKACF